MTFQFNIPRYTARGRPPCEEGGQKEEGGGHWKGKGLPQGTKELLVILPWTLFQPGLAFVTCMFFFVLSSLSKNPAKSL